MNATKFDEIVRNRANARVQARIELFKQEFVILVAKLFDTNPSSLIAYVHRGYGSPEVQAALRSLGTVTLGNVWPRELWENENAKVEEELLRVMDEMQKALISRPPGAGDAKPNESSLPK